MSYMAIRYEEATQLYQETLKRITKDEKNWTAFLKVACKNYRLPFSDMVMIYAQRPDATAVLEMEDWNRRYGLWIKSGSKGIAVFDDEYQGNARLKYYFDISDTRASKQHRQVPVWNMKLEYETEVIETLIDKFGPLNQKDKLVSAILSSTANIVEDNIKDYLNDLQYCKEGTMLEELDEQNTAIIYQNVINASVAYAVLTRCGIHAEDYISEDDLRQISLFTGTSINAVGVPVKDMSQMIINENRRTVLLLERNENRTFADESVKNYNEDEKETTMERSQESYGTKLYTDGRVSDTQSHIETGEDGGVRQVRIDEEKISQGTPSDSVYELFDNTDLESTSNGDRQDSQSTQRTADDADEGKDGSQRATQGSQPNGMDTSDEQHRGNDSRTDQERTDLHLNTETAGTKSSIPAFFTQDEFEELLKYDRFRSHKNKDIQTVFQFFDDKEHRLAYIKESFTTTIIEFLYQEERLGFQRSEEKDMLRVWKGSYLNPKFEGYVTWDVITAYTEDMIQRNAWVSIPIKPLLSTQEQQLNLFEIESFEPAENKEKLPFSMPQHIVDAVLAEGTEERDSKIQIALFLSLDLPIKENVQMLKNLYKKGSNGFIIDNKHVAYTWDGDGIHISWGKGIVTSFDKQSLSWEDVSKGIRNLLETGRYMPQEDLDKLNDYEYKDISVKLLYMCQNMNFEVSDHMMELREYYHMGFVDGPPKVAELLKTKDFYDRTLQDLFEFNQAYQQNHDLMNWKQYTPDKMITAMEYIAIPHLDFRAADYHEPDYAYFITQDTIDEVLTAEHRTNQKYDTLSFYRNHNDKKERIKFLKNIWGMAGNNRYLSDSKGIEIKTGSYNKPYAKTLLKWKDVADRIAYLIAHDKYLTTEEKAGMEDHERHTITMEIENFFYHLPFHNIRPYRIAYGFFNEDKALFSFLSKKDNIEHVLDLMHIALRNTEEGSQYHEQMNEELSHVLEFYYGTYSLFHEKKEPTIYTPYEPILSARETIAKTLTTFMAEYDPNNFKNQYQETDFEAAVSDTQMMLNDIGGLEDLILFLNKIVYEQIENPLFDKAMILREEISMLYAERKGSDLTKNSESGYSYDPVISNEQPRYNDGDIVFFQYENKQIYGKIEVVDEDEVILNLFSDSYDGDGMIEVDIEDFEKAILHDYRNGYLYDQNRPFFRVEKKAPKIYTPYEPILSSRETIAKTLTTLIPYQENIETKPTQKETFVDMPRNEKEIIIPRKLYPNVSDTERRNYQITDDSLGSGGLKEKYQNNVSAIKLLKQLEQEQRLATPEEQQVLSNYVGWGALADAFDDTKEKWKNEYEELKAVLNDTEYKAARESTLTAFYTPPIIIEAIYQKLMDMGLKEGNLLEPSCGIGNFMGMQPEGMDCNFYGVELDSISGRIAQQLYQKATIDIKGFEQTELSDNLFDAVVGNVPYGQLPVYDPKYNQQHFMIHDYFFAKALDKVKVGGIVVFLTSKFTMDKKNRNVRKYIAQRADLLGAIRLPDDTFSLNAGTRVTSDILFLQKRERPFVDEPEWLDVMSNKDGIVMNSYFVNHPEMCLGTMVEEPSQYGVSTSCKPYENADIKQLLEDAMSNIKSDISMASSLYVDEEDQSIPADPTVRNYSYCIVDGTIYYRENSRMYPYTTSKTGENRIRGMIQIRDAMRQLIVYQTDDDPQDKIEQQQTQLHDLYDSFTNKYDLLNSRGNKQAFQDDSSYNLICSLEVLNEDKTLKKKADIFYKRTIKPRKQLASVKSANEALIVCMSEKGHVDFSFMTQISEMEEPELIQSLNGVIYPNPEKKDENGNPVYETADEYLSGNVREKLIYAKHAAMKEPQLYQMNVTALEQVQPEPIKAGDISVRLGTTWIPRELYKEFMYQLLDTPSYYRSSIDIQFVTSTQEWNVTRKSLDCGVKATKSFGTHRVNAYKIIENTLNLRDVKVFDKTTDENGKEVRVLNKKETAIAQDKQDLIKSEFSNWIWKDPERREQLCTIYNERFNSIRNRTYDGSHLSFIGMNPDITLRKHQVDAIARILYGGNTLLAHSVGAGKTFEMIAAGMESKRLGFCSKPLYVVPNNIIGDFASDFYRLYPSANVLVATTDTLSKANRHKFFARIAAGDWDGVIITHSQFIKMPISAERQRIQIRNQVEEISNNIKMLKESDGERFTIKQLEKMKYQLSSKLDKLNDSTKKDDILCFEQLGIDMLFVDEADLFKNLFLYSKMRNVSGISQTDSQRASDLFMKTQYLNELTGYRGVVFATGTAISNSMAELYTMQRYLQYDVLKKNELESFDAWASTFGETVTAMELSPDGKGFKMKTRFSKFYNLPELMTMFREVADIQTPEMLNLPVPKVQFDIISVPASDEQEKMIKSLGERAEKIRNREVKPYEDNMLKITSDGRKLALDQRLMNPLLPEHEGSKVNACIEQVYKLWEDSADIKGTQLLFCDLSTPTADSKNINDDVIADSNDVSVFNNVYEEVKKKLVKKGIPSNEIAFIHDAKTDIQRKELFAKTRQGSVRILLGSTSKMGAGTNVQDLIVALHDLDCPWRPRDLEQRRGRGIRQGNINETVHVIRYVTEGTFDAYLTGKTPQRSMEEIDDAVMEYAAIKAIACGDPKIMERCNLEMEVNKLNTLKASYQNQIYELQDSILKTYPKQIALNKEIIQLTQKDILIRDQHPLLDGEEFIGMELGGVHYQDKAEAGNMLLLLCRKHTSSEPVLIGNYRGFDMKVSFNQFNAEYMLTLEHGWEYTISLGSDKSGNLTRINNALNGIEKIKEKAETTLSLVQSQLETAKIEVNKPFEHEDKLQEKSKRLAKLTIELKLDEKEPSIIDENEIDTVDDRETNRRSRQRER